MKSVLIIISLFTLTMGCNTSKSIKNDTCSEYNQLLTEYKSKLEFVADSCYMFKFENDRTKYIDYNEFGGKNEFMDYRLNEVLFYQHNLTNEFLDLSEIRTECLQSYTKKEILTLFGDNYDYNEHYQTISYQICNYGQDKNLNFLMFKIGENEFVESISINMFQL